MLYSSSFIKPSFLSCSSALRRSEAERALGTGSALPYYGAFRWQGRLRHGSHPPLISKDLFDKACAALHGNARPYTNRRGFALTTFSPAEIVGARFWAKGRHNGWGYVPEKEIARLFEPAVKAVTLDEEVVEWLEDALKESDKSSCRLSENRLNSLQNDLAKVNQRLSRLYDAKFDGDSIDEEVFKIKESEYKASIAEIKAQIRTLGDGNPNFYQDACRTLELSKRLFPSFLSRATKRRRTFPR